MSWLRTVLPPDVPLKNRFTEEADGVKQFLNSLDHNWKASGLKSFANHIIQEARRHPGPLIAQAKIQKSFENVLSDMIDLTASKLKIFIPTSYQEPENRPDEEHKQILYELMTRYFTYAHRLLGAVGTAYTAKRQKEGDSIPTNLYCLILKALSTFVLARPILNQIHGVPWEATRCRCHGLWTVV